MTFSVVPAPIQPRIEAKVTVHGFSQSVRLELDAARDLYRRLGDAILDADRARTPAADENRSPGSLEGAA